MRLQAKNSTHTRRCDRQEDHDAATATSPNSPSSRKLASNEGCVSKGKHLGNRCNWVGTVDVVECNVQRCNVATCVSGSPRAAASINFVEAVRPSDGTNG